MKYRSIRHIYIENDLVYSETRDNHRIRRLRFGVEIHSRIAGRGRPWFAVYGILTLDPQKSMPMNTPNPCPVSQFLYAYYTYYLSFTQAAQAGKPKWAPLHI